MKLRFTKMHGLGNDFVMLDAINQQVSLNREQIRFLADRRFGVGCDQVLLVERPRSAETEFYYRIFNADGSEVEQCGNGARCFARFVRDQGLTANDVISVGTARGEIRLYIEDNGDVRVNMGRPRLDPADIPLRAPARKVVYKLQLADRTLDFGAVSMGNPHAILRVEDVALAPVETIGPAVEAHEDFPNRVNVGFLAVQSRSRIDLRVYERGAGETLACGTGACAAVVWGRIAGLLDERVEVRLPGGQLVVSWEMNDAPVWMIGPATRVFHGEITL